MGPGTCSADVPGIAKDYIEGKYMYVHSYEFKSLEQAQKNTEDSVYSSEKVRS
jgi:hypothetical protein